MDFKNAIELLELCKKHDLPISEVMRQREIIEGEKEADTVHDAMARVLEINYEHASFPENLKEIQILSLNPMVFFLKTSQGD